MNEGNDFKVTLESLYTNKIKEISFDEEESYQEKPTLSQKLTELAQRVDFTSKVEGSGSEPAPKKAAQNWPWEFANSKLRQALTEVNVLSDIIQITQHQEKYVALDPVVATFSGSASPSYQYVVKKKALGIAAEILQKGTTSLSPSSADKEKEFHKALSSLRQQWKLKRIGSGAIIGDLSYHSSGSTYCGPVPFDVCKRKPNEETVSADSAKDVISITIPREWRGSSEILVFLSLQPVQDTPPLSSFPPLSVGQFSQRQGLASSVELQLVKAQNVLFNQELFSLLAKEAYDQKPVLQHGVFSDRIVVPLSMDCWLSILYVREYDNSSLKALPTSSFPPPRWDLVVALKQLLRESHSRQATLVVPRPSTAGFLEKPELRNAGVVPLKTREIKRLDTQHNIFKQFLDKAKHVYNEERLQLWLDELCSVSIDPSLHVVWSPDPSFTVTTAHLVLTDSLASSESSKYSVKLMLEIDVVTVCRVEECGGNLAFPLQREKLIDILKHEVLVQRMKLASKLGTAHKWHVVQELSRPLLSSGLIKSGANYLNTTNLLLESSDGHCKLDLLFHWNDLTISIASLTARAKVGGESVDKWETKTLSIHDLAGSNFREKYILLLTTSFSHH